MAPTPIKTASSDARPKAAPQPPVLDLILAAIEDAKAEDTAIDVTEPELTTWS